MSKDNIETIKSMSMLNFPIICNIKYLMHSNTNYDYEKSKSNFTDDDFNDLANQINF